MCIYATPEVPGLYRGLACASATPLNITCAVDEEMIQGQDHVYVVFTLPALNSPVHRSRTIQPGPWGPDVQANGLMGLVGHSYVQKGAAQCLSHYDGRMMISECFLTHRTCMVAMWRDPVPCK